MTQKQHYVIDVLVRPETEPLVDEENVMAGNVASVQPEGNPDRAGTHRSVRNAG